MARRPRRQEAVATALQGGRPQRDGVRRLLRRAVALGGGAIDLLLLGPLRRLIWRWLHSRNVRRGSVAARMAKRAWRDDAEPAGYPVLRRAVARAGGAIQAMLAPGSRALAVVRNLPQRALALGRHYLQRVLRQLVPGFLRSLLHPRRLCQEMQPPPPTPKKKKNAGPCMYGDPPRRPAVPPPPSPPPLSPPPRELVIVDGEEVSDELVQQYAEYCRLASRCPAKWTICHFCFFEIQKSENFTVHTDFMFSHCNQHHFREGPSVRCDESGCSVRVRPGRDQALHVHFCHRRTLGWWMQIKQNQKAS